MELITTSQNTMREMITIMNHQETTLRRIVNRDYDDTINTVTTLRRENEELRRMVNNRTPQPTPRLNVPSPSVNPLWSQRELRPIATTLRIPTQSNEPLIFNRTTREPLRNPNLSFLPNNQDQFMRRYLTNIPDLLFGTIGQELTSVVVRPTDRQIRESTQLVRFGNIIDPQNGNCPISLERFDEQQLVTRIIFCGHIFSTNELQRWFETNVRCPLCRFDIREHRNQVSRNNLSTVNEEENSTISSEINSQSYPEPPPPPQEESTNENIEDNEYNEEEIYNNLSRNVDNLLSVSDEIANNLTTNITNELTRTLSENIHALRPLDNINITATNILDVFNNDISGNLLGLGNRQMFINNYLDNSNNHV
jgi:hypothetical protein